MTTLEQAAREERAAFEEWAPSSGAGLSLHVGPYGGYFMADTAAAWSAWQARAALAAGQAQPVAPAGWKLAPVAITEDMLTAGERWCTFPHRVWAAMLSASPPAPAVRPLTEEEVVMDGLMMLPTEDAKDCAKAFTAGVRFAERAHGISAAGGAEG